MKIPDTTFSQCVEACVPVASQVLPGVPADVVGLSALYLKALGCMVSLSDEGDYEIDPYFIKSMGYAALRKVGFKNELFPQDSTLESLSHEFDICENVLCEKGLIKANPSGGFIALTALGWKKIRQKSPKAMTLKTIFEKARKENTGWCPSTLDALKTAVMRAKSAGYLSAQSDGGRGRGREGTYFYLEVSKALSKETKKNSSQ